MNLTTIVAIATQLLRRRPRPAPDTNQSHIHDVGLVSNGTVTQNAQQIANRDLTINNK